MIRRTSNVRRAAEVTYIHHHTKDAFEYKLRHLNPPRGARPVALKYPIRATKPSLTERSKIRRQFSDWPVATQKMPGSEFCRQIDVQAWPSERWSGPSPVRAVGSPLAAIWDLK